MNRLTKRCNGVVTYIGASNEYETGQIACEVSPQGVRELLDRLAAFEDTETEPEEIAAMRHTLDEYHKAADSLLLAKAQGRVVVLPCKVGDTVYYRCGKRITDFEVVGFSVDRKGASIIYAEHHADENGTAYSYFFDVNKVGRTVFFTREEAEQALRKKEVTE